MQYGICPPRAPGFGRLQERTALGASDPANDEIAFEKGVRVAERAHGDVFGGPTSDSRNGHQCLARGYRIASSTEVQRARRDEGGERTNRACALTRQTVLLQGSLGQRLRTRKQTPLARVHDDRGPEAVDETRTERAGTGNRRLLADDGSHRELEAVPRAGHAQPGTCANQRREPSIGA
jgi:hypothetical protein